MVPEIGDEHVPLIKVLPPAAHLDVASEFLQAISVLSGFDAPPGDRLTMPGKALRHRGKKRLLFPLPMQEQVLLEGARDLLQAVHRVSGEGFLELAKLLQESTVFEREDLGHLFFSHDHAASLGRNDPTGACDPGRPTSIRGACDGLAWMERFDRPNEKQPVSIVTTITRDFI
jgi:hypothetical protein